MDFALDGGHPIFGFGISSKGPICLENTVAVRGANNASEARLLSTASGTAFRDDPNEGRASRSRRRRRRGSARIDKERLYAGRFGQRLGSAPARTHRLDAETGQKNA